MDHAAHQASAGANQTAATGPHAGHDKHAGHSVAMFRDKFWLSLILTVPVLIWSMDPQEWLGYMAPMFPGSMYLPAVLGTIVFFYGGLVFVRGAAGELQSRQPGMMTLISLAIVVAFVTSWAGTLGLFEVEIWWELATLITIMLLGHWLEMRSIAQAQGALAALAALLPDTAERIDGDTTVSVSLADLRLGDIVLVRPGARVPVDGTVAEGTADLDKSIITGESMAVTKGPGDDVIAGAVVAGGSLRVRVDAIGEETALSGIMRLVAAAQASKSRAQALADRAAAILFYVALSAGLITLAYWWLSGDQEGALVRTATVLVIACPHALGLAIPLVVSISTSLGARNGLLVKDRLALERAREIDTVIFDKTGTLTRGAPVLVAVSSDDPDVLRMAAAVEADSEHPLARAIVEGAARRDIIVPRATAFESLAGRGAQGKVDGRTVIVGGPRLLDELGLAPVTDNDAWAAEGRTVLHVIVDGAVIGAVAVEDEIRPEIGAGHRPSARGRRPGRHDHRRQPGRGQFGRRTAGDRRCRCPGPAGRQGRGGRTLSAGRSDRGDGRRWRERRARTCPGRCRDRHRRRHGRGRRVGRDRPGQERPTRRRRGDHPVAGDLRQDDPEPGLGDGLQPDRDPGRGRGAGLIRDRPADGGRGRRDEPVHDHRGGQCPTTASDEASAVQGGRQAADRPFRAGLIRRSSTLLRTAY